MPSATTVTWFIGGVDDIGFVDPIEFSMGSSSWTVAPDPRDPSNNLSVGDVNSNPSGDVLGFKHEVDDDTFLGYAIFN